MACWDELDSIFLNHSRVDKIESEDDPIRKSLSESEASTSKKDTDESQKLPWHETASVENSNSSSLKLDNCLSTIMDAATMDTLEIAHRDELDGIFYEKLENIFVDEPTSTENPSTHPFDRQNLNYSGLDEIESKEYPSLPDDPIKKSLSEPEASTFKKNTDESQEFLPAASVENSNASPLSPDCYWSDEKIDDGEFEEFPVLTEEQVIRLGEVMIIMLCQGPLHRVEEIVAALAFNIRDPEDVKTHLLTVAKCGETVVTLPLGRIGESATGSSLESIGASATRNELEGIGSPETILELEKLIDRHKYPRKEDVKDIWVKCIVKEKGNVKSYDCRTAIKEFFQVTFRWNDELRAAFYCFLAAFLMRSGVKNRAVMAKHWSKVPCMFGVFYPTFTSPPAPLLSRQAFRTLNKQFRPGTKLMKTVMRAFLKKRFEPELPQNVKNCLMYALLSHTFYHGMKLATLTHTALRFLGDQRICAIRKFDSDDNRLGINALVQHCRLYCEGGPLYSSCKYLPWCRMLDMKYWSNLSPKAHPTLATLLMCFQIDQGIWKMKSFKPTEESKAKSKEMAEIIQRVDVSKFRVVPFREKESK